MRCPGNPLLLRHLPDLLLNFTKCLARQYCDLRVVVVCVVLEVGFWGDQKGCCLVLFGCVCGKVSGQRVLGATGVLGRGGGEVSDGGEGIVGEDYRVGAGETGMRTDVGGMVVGERWGQGGKRYGGMGQGEGAAGTAGRRGHREIAVSGARQKRSEVDGRKGGVGGVGGKWIEGAWASGGGGVGGAGWGREGGMRLGCGGVGIICNSEVWHELGRKLAGDGLGWFHDIERGIWGREGGGYRRAMGIGGLGGRGWKGGCVGRDWEWGGKEQGEEDVVVLATGVWGAVGWSARLVEQAGEEVTVGERWGRKVGCVREMERGWARWVDSEVGGEWGRGDCRVGKVGGEDEGEVGRWVAECVGMCGVGVAGVYEEGSVGVISGVEARLRVVLMRGTEVTEREARVGREGGRVGEGLLGGAGMGGGGEKILGEDRRVGR
ncbi:hypothetical protein Tco_0544248 [Tanacetum coccineum]